MAAATLRGILDTTNGIISQCAIQKQAGRTGGIVLIPAKSITPPFDAFNQLLKHMGGIN